MQNAISLLKLLWPKLDSIIWWWIFSYLSCNSIAFRKWTLFWKTELSHCFLINNCNCGLWHNIFSVISLLWVEHHEVKFWVTLSYFVKEFFFFASSLNVNHDNNFESPCILKITLHYLAAAIIWKIPPICVTYDKFQFSHWCQDYVFKVAHRELLFGKNISVDEALSSLDKDDNGKVRILLYLDANNCRNCLERNMIK